nr:MAG TPA: hypothetical protein [Caudoviricetes sp.]
MGLPDIFPFVFIFLQILPKLNFSTVRKYF